ncbi:MAG: amidase [Candidatus Dormiibacter spiritus]|nr:MAG: amidase [Candidatus Dormibacteraeota bacterium]
MNHDDLCYTPVVELRRLLTTRSLSASELVRSLLERVDDINGPINAIVALRAEGALKDAQAADETPPADWGAVTGIPFTIKDLNETVDMPTTLGSRAFAGHQPSFDAEIVSRLRRAGGILVGKTNTPEFGLRATTENQLYGTSRNPWNLDHNPGGSSGGAAAALAAGISPLAQGSDGGGSIRNPASSCAVVGLKPTRGRVPGSPASYESWVGLATDGPMACTVRDVALMLDVIGGPVVGEPYGLPIPSTSFLSNCDRKPDRCRIGYTVTPAHGQVHPEVAEAVLSAAGMFEELGHEVVEACPDLTGLREPFKTIIAGNSGALTNQIDPARLGDLEPTTLSVMLRGHALTAADYCLAVSTARSRSAQIMHFWQDHDFLLAPVMTQLPPPIHAMPSQFDLETIWREISDLGAFTYPFNITGQPAISLPCAWSREGGLPIGIQLVGGYGDEAGLLGLSASFEEARPWRRMRPPFRIGGLALGASPQSQAPEFGSVQRETPS